ncbi:DNA-directed RNA polymerase III subunit RPC10-like [Carica papaya]|uniref:DNA-directed RNA polymerase III subunit RPC10-like n=1 Tax=Carica papaya TaxID=3649 RepID=UPI000B8C9FF8|nr:DNA-directed RNA polymerase III subunit RPC10-like [Carica papaya]
MEFCPTCGNLLLYERRERNCRFFCPACPYVAYIEDKVKIRRKTKLVRKEGESAHTQEDMLKGKAKTEATCPKCQHDKALFESKHIPSADEPETRFYKCLNPSCGHTWKEE